MSGSKNNSVKSAPVLRGMVRLTSLGCPKNFVDTELASASFLCAGFGLTADDDEADIQFVNTCAFLQEARDEASEVIRDLRKWKKLRKGRKIMVAGCFVEWASPEELEKYSYVDVWLRIDSIAEAGTAALNLYRKEKVALRDVPERPAYLYSHETPRIQLTPAHYAYLKISDGCDNCCAYCLIPSIRGSLRSRSIESVVEEARMLIGNGVRELILIAQDSGGFGRDRSGEPELAELLRQLDCLAGEFYLRLMYMHPASVNDELLTVMKGSKHLIRCIEMPLQHIAENVLKKMGRKVFEERTREVVDQIRSIGYSIRTTFLTGFPGETEEDFQKLLSYVKEVRFERLGVFAYSCEAGTPAASFADQVDPEVGAARRDALMEAQSLISLERNRELTGSEIDVIVDEVISKGKAIGRTLFDAPDIDNAVNLRSKRKLQTGDIVRAKVLQVSEYELDAEIV